VSATGHSVEACHGRAGRAALDRAPLSRWRCGETVLGGRLLWAAPPRRGRDRGHLGLRLRGGSRRPARPRAVPGRPVHGSPWLPAARLQLAPTEPSTCSPSGRLPTGFGPARPDPAQPVLGSPWLLAAHQRLAQSEPRTIWSFWPPPDRVRARPARPGPAGPWQPLAAGGTPAASSIRA